ncbi:MAG: TonB-dependent receptor [Planctomycetota bacterium]
MIPGLASGLVSLAVLLPLRTETPSSAAPPSGSGPAAGSPAQAGEEAEDEAADTAAKTAGEDLLKLRDVVVTATRGPHAAIDLARSVTIADEKDLEHQSQLVALDALDRRIGVWVEKRNVVSSDPVLRGLSGANVLALVDGNSLTTLWGEGGYAGDDMYGKVDGESVRRIEVVRGPSSVLYGSNALGGVINFLTWAPPLDYTEAGAAYGGRLKSTYASSSDSVLGRIDAWGATPWARYRVGFTFRDMDHVRGGGSLGLLKPSGGQDYNWDVSSEFLLAENQVLEVSGQLVNRNNIPKYFRPTQRNFNDRAAVAAKWRSEDTPLGDRFEWTVYVQDKEDERVWLDREMHGVAQWRTISTDFQSSAAFGDGNHLLTWGFHANIDEGESPDDEQFTITTPATGTQKASPDSTWTNTGAYAQDEWILSDDWSVVTSARIDWFRYHAAGNTFWTIPGSTAAENVPMTDPGTTDETALTGGIGVVRHLDPDWTIHGSWSRGYRLFPPNFGLRQSGFGIVAPTDGFLDPITGDQLEIGTRAVRDGWEAAVAVYYTFFHNFQQPTPGEWNGMTEYDLDGSGTIDADESIFVVDEAKGYVTGIEVETVVDLSRFHSDLENWSWVNGFMINEGEVEYEGDEEPLRHTHPPRWITALRWEEDDPVRQGWFEASADIVDRYDDVAESRLTGDVGYLNDPQDPGSGLLRPYGLPGFTIFDLRGGLQVGRNIALTLGLENIFDKKYRMAHSRMDAAGRTLLAGLEITR